MAEPQKILLGVTGSIAAYKAAHLTRLFVKAGAEVKVIMTPAAADFITPLTLATLSKNPVFSEYFDSSDGSWNSHVELGLWADAFVIAPATANSISAFAHGSCSNLLQATYLSARCPVYIAPAMDLDMFAHPATTGNIQRLVGFGNIIIEPEDGELASGLEGRGRLAEPETIARRVLSANSRAAAGAAHPGSCPLAGKKALVTAGPTYEAIDPVRFIGNHSTGTMGYNIADRLAELGAEVTLVSGPTSIAPAQATVRCIRVKSAEEMHAEADKAFAQADITVLAAAVADYRPAVVHDQKIKKNGNSRRIDLVRTVDIAASLAEKKQTGQFVVGFALETENEEANALDKLKRKKFYMIVLNSLRDKGAGFGTSTNKVRMLFPGGELIAGDLKSKREVAADIAAAICKALEVSVGGGAT